MKEFRTITPLAFAIFLIVSALQSSTEALTYEFSKDTPWVEIGTGVFQVDTHKKEQIISEYNRKSAIGTAGLGRSDLLRLSDGKDWLEEATAKAQCEQKKDDLIKKLTEAKYVVLDDSPCALKAKIFSEDVSAKVLGQSYMTHDFLFAGYYTTRIYYLPLGDRTKAN